MANAEERMLEISLYDGEFLGEILSLSKICVVEGRVAPYGRRPFSPLEEALRLLEMCTEKYAPPPPRGDCFTAFIGRKNRGDTEVELLIRLDLHARNGVAVASVVGLGPRCDTERVRYDADDSAVAIVLNVLRASLGRQ